MKKVFIFIQLLVTGTVLAQGLMSPELLWSLGRVHGETVSKDGKTLFYTVSSYNVESNKSETQLFALNIESGNANLISNAKSYAGNACFDGGGNLIYLKDGTVFHDLLQRSLGIDHLEYSNILPAPNGKLMAFSRRVKVDTSTLDRYPGLDKAKVRIYDDLMFRHWNSWADEYYTHLFICKMAPDGLHHEVNITAGEPYHALGVPFGDVDEMNWSPDSKFLAYTSVKKKGKEYSISTNSDIYLYDFSSGQTTNLTQGMMGYDKHPSFSPDGQYLAWTSMARDGYESDKNDLYIMDLSTRRKFKLTANWDESVNSFIWSPDSKSLIFNAAYRGGIHIFELNFKSSGSEINSQIRQITNGDFDYNDLIGFSGQQIIGARTDMNHAAELFSINRMDGSTKQLTQVNTNTYNTISLSKVEKHWIKTSDGKQMLSWVIFPPNFDSTKKYPTLLYCQGGPQSALSQFYSFRWNFQLMAAKGYIIVAPNRRGMPGWGTAWNEQISGDWSGQCMKDYLAAIDQVSTKAYVDLNRRGAVGASFGGYSVFMLAGMHQKRFKTFISHCGSFNLESWYGSTEELWFANWDLKGPYWDKKASKGIDKHSPHNYIQNWDQPILIIQGGLDFRIPDTQAFEAFTAARLHDLKSRLVYLPDEGHHVLKIQNGLIWQYEFFRWLEETL